MPAGHETTPRTWRTSGTQESGGLALSSHQRPYRVSRHRNRPGAFADGFRQRNIIRTWLLGASALGPYSPSGSTCQLVVGGDFRWVGLFTGYRQKWMMSTASSGTKSVDGWRPTLATT